MTRLVRTLLAWHKQKITLLQKWLGLSHYQLIWLAFIEGVLIGLLLGWWLI
jgi:hypothetical protein